MKLLQNLYIFLEMLPCSSCDEFYRIDQDVLQTVQFNSNLNEPETLQLLASDLLQSVE